MESLLTLPIFWKAIALVVLVGVISFWYTFKTGRSFWDDLNSRNQAQAGEAERLDKAGD